MSVGAEEMAEMLSARMAELFLDFIQIKTPISMHILCSIYFHRPSKGLAPFSKFFPISYKILSFLYEKKKKENWKEKHTKNPKRWGKKRNILYILGG